MATHETEVPAAATGGEAAPRVQFHAVGRRKRAVARVFLRPGRGRWFINGRSLDEYFPRLLLQKAVQQPFEVTGTAGRFDVKVNVTGGGLTGQADAIKLGVARALLLVDPEFRPRLRAAGLLTRDPREVERKKYGRPKARKRFQFSKR